MAHRLTITHASQPSPLLDLPGDIIHLLIYALAEIDRPRYEVKFSYRTYRARSLGWITASHVCRYLRTIILDMSALWAGIICVFPAAVEAIHQRTKATPLTLDLTEVAEPDQTWNTIMRLDMLARTQTLRHHQDSIFEKRRPVRLWPSILANKTLPYLRHLSLNLHALTDASASQAGPFYAPNLVTLSLNVPFPIIAPKLQSFHAVCAAESTWPIELLLDFLSHYPRLTELIIDSVHGDDKSDDPGSDEDEDEDDDEGVDEEVDEDVDEDDGTDADVDEDVAGDLLPVIEEMEDRITRTAIVHLPHLRSLTFKYAGAQALELVQHLEIPATITRFFVENVHERSILRGLFTYLGLCDVPRNVLTLTDVDNFVEGYTLWISFTEHESYNETNTMDFKRGLLFGYKPSKMGDEIVGILTAIPSPESIHTLTLNHRCNICARLECGGTLGDSNTASSLHAAISRFSNVATLYLDGQEGAIHAPTLIAHQETSTGDWSYSLHDLRELVLTVNRIASKTWWNDLLGSLQAREAAGHSITRLTIRGNGACHAYLPESPSESKSEVYAKVTDGFTGEEAVAVWLEHCKVEVGRANDAVIEFVDERDMDACNCGGAVLEGWSPWSGLTGLPRRTSSARHYGCC